MVVQAMGKVPDGVDQLRLTGSSFPETFLLVTEDLFLVHWGISCCGYDRCVPWRWVSLMLMRLVCNLRVCAYPISRIVAWWKRLSSRLVSVLDHVKPGMWESGPEQQMLPFPSEIWMIWYGPVALCGCRLSRISRTPFSQIRSEGTDNAIPVPRSGKLVLFSDVFSEENWPFRISALFCASEYPFFRGETPELSLFILLQWEYKKLLIVWATFIDNVPSVWVLSSLHVQSTLVISTSVISNNRLSRRKNLVLV